MEESQQKIQKGKNSFFYAHGRRKEAAARVRLHPGKGLITINDKPLDEYFPTEVEKQEFMRPFHLTKSESMYFVTVRVTGSGKAGQLDAVVHGISRALNVANPEFRQVLKKAGLLKRDARVKERRKYGMAQKARKGKQSPKR